jgi:hypothetical protein
VPFDCFALLSFLPLLLSLSCLCSCRCRCCCLSLSCLVSSSMLRIHSTHCLLLQHPELFEALGVAQPKGVLLYGPPGTGKTLLARAVAHHTDCTFIRVSGSELVQKYIGEGSRMVREVRLTIFGNRVFQCSQCVVHLLLRLTFCPRLFSS